MVGGDTADDARNLTNSGVPSTWPKNSRDVADIIIKFPLRVSSPPGDPQEQDLKLIAGLQLGK